MLGAIKVSQTINTRGKRGFYQFRMRVPLDLVKIVGKKEITQSLQTTDIEEAKRINSDLRTHYSKIFDLLRKTKCHSLAAKQVVFDLLLRFIKLDITDSNAISSEYLIELKKKIQSGRIQTVSFGSLLEAKIGVDPNIKINISRLKLKIPTGTPEYYYLLNSMFNSDVEEFCEALIADCILYINNKIDRIDLTNLIDEFSFNLLIVLKGMAGGLDEHFDEQGEKRIDYGKVKDAFLVRGELPNISTGLYYTSSGSDTVDASVLYLTDIFEMWAKESKPKQNTQTEWKSIVKRFEASQGRIPVRGIKSSHVREFINSLQYYPASPRRDIAALPFKDIIAKAKELKLRPLSDGSIEKALTAIKSILNYAVSQEIIDDNPASKVKPPKSDRPSRKRLSFTEQDLIKIFNSQIYQGKDLKFSTTDSASYWIPLIALFTGCRLEEIGQLSINDIVNESDVWHINIHDYGEGSSLKTDSSIRIVPIHSELIKIGFLKYRQFVADKGFTSLFPQFKRNKQGKLTKEFSRDINRKIDRAGVTDPNKTFHSFRHKFKTLCRLAEIQEDIHDALTGHVNSSVGRSYGSGHSIKRLNTEIQKIEVPINLEHLYDK